MISVVHWVPAIVVSLVAAASARSAEVNKYLPEDTEIVTGVNVTALIESPLVQKQVPVVLKKYHAAIIDLLNSTFGDKVDKESAKLIADRLKDADTIRKFLNDNKSYCHRVLFATTVDTADEKALLIFEGEFKRDELLSFMERVAKDERWGISLKRVQEGKHDYWVLKPSSGADEMFLAVPDGTTVLLSQKREDIVKALDRAGRDKSGVRKEMQEVMARIDPKAGIWYATVPKEKDEYVNAIAQLIVTDGLIFKATVTAKDADGAREQATDLKIRLKGIADGFEDLARQYKPIKAALEVLKTVEPRVERNTVVIELSLPAETIEKIVKELPEGK